MVNRLRRCHQPGCETLRDGMSPPESAGHYGLLTESDREAGRKPTGARKEGATIASLRLTTIQRTCESRLRTNCRGQQKNSNKAVNAVRATVQLKLTEETPAANPNQDQFGLNFASERKNNAAGRDKVALGNLTHSSTHDESRGTASMAGEPAEPHNDAADSNRRAMPAISARRFRLPLRLPP